MELYLYRENQEWNLVPLPRLLPQGKYELVGPFEATKAYKLLRFFNVIPFLPYRAKQFVQINKELTTSSASGILQRLLSPWDWHYGDKIYPGIVGLKWRCIRCGSYNVDTEECPDCHKKNCLVCRDCYNLGPVRLCHLYKWREPGFNNERTIEPKIPFTLTNSQKKAVSEIEELIKKGQKKILLHAACGAGKTEVAAMIMANTLSLGGQVLYAVPRRDVAIEVGERLRNYFPEVRSVILCGGSSEKYHGEQLVAATTHQVLKFKHTFDLTVLDEGDAFPYRGNILLNKALEKANRGIILYLTATPTKSMKKTFSSSEVVFLASRHHKHSLPVPIFYRKGLETAIKEIEPPLLLFVPFKKDVANTVKWLKNHRPSWQIAGVSSETEERTELVQGIKNGSIQALIATSVLERGITVNGVSVIVFKADCNSIYTKEVLVQIAGRAGRTTENPEGVVLFVAKKINKDMREAKTEIITLNRMAKARGELLC